MENEMFNLVLLDLLSHTDTAACRPVRRYN